MKRFALSAAACLCAMAFALPVATQNLKKPQLEQLAASPALQKAPSFSAFLNAAAVSMPGVQPAAAAYAAGKKLSDQQLQQLGRLLGLYNRLNYQAAAIDSIAAMVALPTVRDAKVPPHESPAMVAFGTLVERMAHDFGLQYRNVHGRIFEVRLPGSGSDEFGILTHADVVPVVASEWVLDDGRQLDPFVLTRVDGLLYGRGSIDDKGSIATVLYAMKAVKDSGLPLARGIRLMIETTEETGGDAMKYYRERTSLPAYNIVLDSKYPAVVAEKGSGALKVSFPVQATSAQQTTITAMAGAASANAIAQTATATLRGGDMAAVAAKLEAAKAGFVQQYTAQGGTFSIDVTPSADQVQVKVTGTSAHGSRPEEGVNPVPRLALFLQSSGVDLAPNHYAHAVRYINDLYGTGYWGEKLGVGYGDDFMGPLTMSPNLIRENAGQLEVTVNVRMPRGQSPESLKPLVSSKIEQWAQKNAVPLAVQYDQGNWMARDPSGAWLSTLLNIFGDTTGLPAEPVATAGSTTAKLMPNAINFGPAMPGKKYTAHNAKEFKEVADLNADMQMFTEMLVRIGNLPKMN